MTPTSRPMGSGVAIPDAAVRRLAVAAVCVLVVATGCGADQARRSSCPGAAAGVLLGPPDGGAYFGVNLDWNSDSPARLARRLGRSPALYVAFAPFPLQGGAAGYIDGIVDGLVAQHAALMLTLEPNGGLGTVTDSS